MRFGCIHGYVRVKKDVGGGGDDDDDGWSMRVRRILSRKGMLDITRHSSLAVSFHRHGLRLACYHERLAYDILQTYCHDRAMLLTHD